MKAIELKYLSKLLTVTKGYRLFWGKNLSLYLYEEACFLPK